MGAILRENPVLLKEMRSRMRGGRAFGTLFLYVCFLCGVLYITVLLLRASWAVARGGVSMFSGGRILFTVLSYLQALLIIFITPALTSGSITLEKEQRTLEMLLITLLRAKDIVLGKLVASLSYVFLLLLSSLPLASLCFLFGSISLGEILRGYLLLALFTLFFGSFGLFWSTVFNRTLVSTVFAYATVLFFVLGIYLVTGVISAITFASGMMMHSMSGSAASGGLPSFSPMATFFIRFTNTLNGLTPFSLLSSLLLTSFYNMMGLQGANPFAPYGHPFWNGILFYSLTSCLLLKASMYRICNSGAR